MNLVLPKGLLSALTTFLGGALVVLAFFAPWARTWLGDVSAADLASAKVGYLYGVPIFATAAALVAFLRGRLFNVVGLVFGATLVLLGGWFVDDIERNFGWGFFLFGFGTMLVLVGHFIGFREHGVRGPNAEGGPGGLGFLKPLGARLWTLVREGSLAFAAAWKAFRARGGKPTNVQDLRLLLKDGLHAATPAWRKFRASGRDAA